MNIQTQQELTKSRVQ